MKQLIGESKAIQAVRQRVDELAGTKGPVLVTGEPGTGKSIVAECLHQGGPDASKPFVLLDVSAMDELKFRTIMRSLLTKRLFINPLTSDHGNFDLPHGATVIFDAVDRSSQPAQKTLADFLTEIQSQGYDLRIIVLLEGDLGMLVEEGSLLDELADELRGWERIVMPSLHERVDDIPDLVEHFVRETAKAMELGDVVIDVNALSVLVRKEWRGNVQELKTFVEQVMMLSDNKEVFMLPETLVDEQSELRRMLEKIEEGIDFALDQSMELIEKRILERVLEKFGYNQTKAAKFLKITEDTLRYRMKKLGIALAREE